MQPWPPACWPYAHAPRCALPPASVPAVPAVQAILLPAPQVSAPCSLTNEMQSASASCCHHAAIYAPMPRFRPPGPSCTWLSLVRRALPLRLLTTLCAKRTLYLAPSHFISAHPPPRCQSLLPPASSYGVLPMCPANTALNLGRSNVFRRSRAVAACPSIAGQSCAAALRYAGGCISFGSGPASSRHRGRLAAAVFRRLRGSSNASTCSRLRLQPRSKGQALRNTPGAMLAPRAWCTA